MTREKFPSTIYVQNATVFPSNLTSNFARVKCGNITNIGSSVIATKLILCDLPKALTNKIEVCG